MELPVATLIDPSTAQVFGIAGLIAKMAWPLFQDRETMLTIQLAGTCSFATSYALLGQDTATAVCLTGACQTTVALLAGDRPWLTRMCYLFLPVVLLLGALTFAGLSTVLAVTACCLTMLGRMQQDTLRMRALQLTAYPLGAAHDAVVGAWTNLAGAILSFIVAFMALRHALNTRRLA